MVETRIAPRFRVNKPATIEAPSEKIPCTVYDISLTGAALDVSNLFKVPETFTLVIPEDRLRLPSRVVWRRQFRIGVKFD
jgi:PilZ domain